MQFSLEGIERALPYYLSAERREGVKKALSQFPEIKFFYLKAYDNELLQGDCWSHLTVFNFADGTRKKIHGMLLTNSCDMDENNKSVMAQQVTFCPIFAVNKLVDGWRQAGIDEQRIQSTFAAIKQHELNNFVYLPTGALFTTDMVAWLDEAHTMPYAAFAAENQKKKLATLSDPSFYLFIFKLSLHFCRIHENVDRSEAAESAIT